MGLVAVTGASGKTGWRVVDEALRRGLAVRAIVRPGSVLPPALAEAEQQGRLEVRRLDLSATEALHAALTGCEALVIATGARPSVDLTGPLKVDAFGVRDQIQAYQAVGLRRVVLVSSLCAGRWQHPLNLFGLILVWKRLGERWLEQSGLDWTVVRPGGLSEDDSRCEREGVVFSGPDQQESDSIPRRLVARVCLDALSTPAAIGRIIEITSSPSQPAKPLSQWLTAQAPG
ncbi:SDR family oxidoreductase [Cyanobium sp. Aljojuca 7D2]|uniref:SDR family oxidoreductase n=1 Tax=Cyanobium sp. Aljojuca 7D2 TaxID=2823698 RepID=UPI0020CB859F|nr:SDR family oxidoreductase [Cyanobium sp. Aljojuca 7D2]MCP9889525.1 SDR family oxidoreductase [Cyanobium sp. Aljojuca 7D2]